MAISIYNSARFSLIVQIIICLICSYGLTFKLQPKDKILNELLFLETIVQVIEFIFYIGLVYTFSKVKNNVSVLRYYDWFLTTPTMIFTIIAFMIYKNERKIQEENKENLESHLSLTSIYQENKNIIMRILFFNAVMLGLGVLGEKKIITRFQGFFSGSVAFIYAFYLIYENFVNNILINKQAFWFNFILWSMYGIAYTFSYKHQNIAYNILDIFSKNLNGLLIFGYIYYLVNSYKK